MFDYGTWKLRTYVSRRAGVSKVTVTQSVLYYHPDLWTWKEHQH